MVEYNFLALFDISKWLLDNGDELQSLQVAKSIRNELYKSIAILNISKVFMNLEEREHGDRLLEEL